MAKVLCTVIPQRFEKFGVMFPADWEIEYLDFPYTDEQMIEGAKDADFIFVNATHPVSAAVIAACPNVKLIHSEGVGYDKIDFEAAKEAGIPVCNNAGVNAGAVAEHTIGLILAGLRRTALTDRQMRTIGFAASKGQHLAEGQHEIAGLHIGLVGIGAIGREVVKRLQGWDCKISYYDVFRPTEEMEKKIGVTYLPFEELVKECDVISLHVPVFPETYHMFSTKQFKAMKSNALIVNTARGEIIDQDALAAALESGEIYGAALDTLYPEPTPQDHVLLNLSEKASEKITLTPHTGGMTDEAFTRMLVNAIANMERVLKGETPINIVNK